MIKKKQWEIFSNFVAFSENINFMPNLPWKFQKNSVWKWNSCLKVLWAQIHFCAGIGRFSIQSIFGNLLPGKLYFKYLLFLCFHTQPKILNLIDDASEQSNPSRTISSTSPEIQILNVKYSSDQTPNLEFWLRIFFVNFT